MSPYLLFFLVIACCRYKRSSSTHDRLITSTNASSVTDSNEGNDVNGQSAATVSQGSSGYSNPLSTVAAELLGQKTTSNSLQNSNFVEVPLT